MSMSDQPEHIKREYDQYSLERDRAELERMLIQHEATERMRDELEQARMQEREPYQLCEGCGWPDAECQCPHAARQDLIMADIEQQRQDDAQWDRAWEQFVDELYQNEQLEREHDEDDQRRNDH